MPTNLTMTTKIATAAVAVAAAISVAVVFYYTDDTSAEPYRFPELTQEECNPDLYNIFVQAKQEMKPGDSLNAPYNPDSKERYEKKLQAEEDLNNFFFKNCSKLRTINLVTSRESDYNYYIPLCISGKDLSDQQLWNCHNLATYIRIAEIKKYCRMERKKDEFKYQSLCPVHRDLEKKYRRDTFDRGIRYIELNDIPDPWTSDDFMEWPRVPDWNKIKREYE